MNIELNIDGNSWSLDVDAAKASGILKAKIKHKLGEFYRHKYTNDIYVLCQSRSNEASLICIKSNNGEIDGNRYTDPVCVNDIHNITDDEWQKIATNVDIFVISLIF